MFNSYNQQQSLAKYLSITQSNMDDEIEISSFLEFLGSIPTDDPNTSVSQLDGIIPGSQRLNETIETMQDLNVSGPLGRIIRTTIGPEITKNVNNVGQKVYTIPVSAPFLNHRLEVVNQPEKNDYKFRHEIEKHHAMPIKSKKRVDNGSSWPEIRVTDAPSCPADVWIQLVENTSPVDGHHNPCPSPNGLFHKKGREWTAPHGIIIQASGECGKCEKAGGMKCDECDGVVKLHIPNLANIDGKISFDEHLHLALFRTRALHAWDYLEKRNKTNASTPDKIPRLSQIAIPSNKKNKEAKKRCRLEMDTTRVKLCFQVFLYIGELYPDTQAMDSAPLIHALNPVCSDTIVDKHAHQQLKIECIAPNTLSDTGTDNGLICCSKIEDSDQNNMKLIFTFKDMKGKDKEEVCPIPRKNKSLIHHQYVIKFGESHEFPIPSYRDVFKKKLDIHYHVHATLRLAKYSSNMKELLEESNPVDLIIFPERYEKQKGHCIGSPSETDDLTCKYSIKSEPIKTEPEPQKYNASSIFPKTFGGHNMPPPESQKPLNVSTFKFGMHEMLPVEDPAMQSIILSNRSTKGIPKRGNSQVLTGNTGDLEKHSPSQAPKNVPQNEDSVNTSNMNTDKAINIATEMEKDYPRK